MNKDKHIDEEIFTITLVREDGREQTIDEFCSELNANPAPLPDEHKEFMGRELLSFIGIDKLKELYAKSTHAVSWYAHNTEVRGPFHRWFIVEKGDEQGNKGALADQWDDAAYCAAAMNSVPHLINRIAALEAKLKSAEEMATALEECSLPYLAMNTFDNELLKRINIAKEALKKLRGLA